MKPQDFEFLSTLLKKQSGLILTEDKGYLVESRLLPVARKHGMAGLDPLIEALRLAPANGPLVYEITDAMTTNESFFFRDLKPFDQFRKFVLPRLLAARAATRKIRIWSAACSSGQEPYSLAMILRDEAAKLAGWRLEIVATDISREMLEKCKAGLYSQFEVQRGLPVAYLVKYFTQMGDKWRIDAGLREIIQFKEFNLLQDPAGLGGFDVVFCRNVLIYFDNDTKRTVLERISRMLAQDGFLYLGGAETVLGISDKFQPVPGERGIYARVDQAVPKQAAS
ncbi:MAG: protein-glutamate O-methyltransferase [Alphaproteobacteria bacterium]